jgi:hypothetical protein
MLISSKGLLEPGTPIGVVLDELCPDGRDGENKFRIIGLPIPGFVFGYYVQFEGLHGLQTKTRFTFSGFFRLLPTLAVALILAGPMLGLADLRLGNLPEGAWLAIWVGMWGLAGFAGGAIHMKDDFEERVVGVFTSAAEAKVTRDEMVHAAVELLWVVYYLRPMLANWRSLFAWVFASLFGWLPGVGAYVGIKSMRGWVEPSLFAAIRTIADIRSDQEAKNISTQNVWDHQIKLALTRFKTHKWAWVRFILLQWLLCGVAILGAVIAGILIFLQNGGAKYLP